MTVLLREAIGESLRRARTSQSKTLREVSSSARVSLGYLSEVERGRKEASSELLAAICTALEVPISDVLFDVGAAMADIDRKAPPAAVGADSGHVRPRPGTAESAAAMTENAGHRVVDGPRVVIPQVRGGVLAA